MAKKSSKTAFLAQQKQERIQQQIKNEKRKAVIKKSAITVSCIVAAALAVVLCVSLVLNSGILLKGSVISSENYTVTKGMMSYYIYEQYKSFTDYYGSSLSAMTFDKNRSLKKQYYNETQTFFEFFADEAYTDAKTYVYFCEAAKKAGFDISDQAKDALKLRAENTDLKLYGRGLSLEDVYNALYIRALASSYNSKMYSEAIPEDTDIQKYLEKNTVQCQLVDYLVYSVKYSKDNKADQSKAEETANALAKAETPDDFKLEAVKLYTDGVITTLDPTDESVKKVISQMLSEKIAFTDNDLGDWLFRDAEVNQTKVIQDTTKNCYNVYMLLAKPYLDTTKTVDVRHILLPFGDYDSKEAAKADAERILALYNGTEESFASLALTYSSDLGSSAVGGLYERVEQGSMETEFDAWCFDSSRKSGDTGIVYTSTGYHVMYFCGDNVEAWKIPYISETASDSIYSDYEIFESRYKLTENKEDIYTIPER